MLFFSVKKKDAQENVKFNRRAERPGEMVVVLTYAGSLDLPNTSLTMHSHRSCRPMSSNRNLYEQERCDGISSKELIFSVSDVKNLHQASCHIFNIEDDVR